MDSQLKRGVLEICVFAVLNNEDCYGYKLVEIISNSIMISDGTIYPLLKRLKDDGYVETYLQESREGPPRKFYSLTKKGRERAKSETKEWQKFYKSVNDLLKQGGL